METLLDENLPRYELSDLERHYDTVRRSWGCTTNTIETFLIGDTTEDVVASVIREHLATLPALIYTVMNTIDGQPLTNGYGAYLSLINLHEDAIRETTSRRNLPTANFPMNRTTPEIRAQDFKERMEEYGKIHTPEDTVEYIEASILKAVSLSVRDNMVALQASHVAHKIERFKKACYMPSQAGKAIASALVGPHSAAGYLVRRGLRHS